MEEGHEAERWMGYVDWRKRPALRGKHGGMPAASFVLVVEVMENLAFLANASNLVRYLTGFMHLSPSRSANAVTNFMGTAFLLALLGGFLSDAFVTAYYIYLLSAFLEFLGLVILTVQARSPSLMPPPCGSSTAVPCRPVSGGKAALLFGGLYLVALGVGGIKGSLPSHGAEQFDESTAKGRRDRSSFFNYFVFCLSCGALVAVTLVVWVEDNKGWQWGFAISTATILLSIPVFVAGSKFYRNKIPTGSPLTIIAKVIAAALLNSSSTQSPSKAAAAVTSITTPTNAGKIESLIEEDDEALRTVGLGSSSSTATTSGLRFLDRAAERNSSHRSLSCTAEEVEDVKAVIRTLPIFLSTVMLNCCLAQLSTFSVQQAAKMNTKIGNLTVPPASLPVFPVLFIILLAPLYDQFIVPLARKVTNIEAGITHLQRIGIGLVLSVIAMAAAALVESKRKRTSPPITFLWVALQYLFLGSADLFALAGLLEFFFTEAAAGMRSLATALSWASLAMGYYLSSVLVAAVNRATRRGGGGGGWLEGGDLNHYRLERFYWLMCGMSAVNFGQYLFWAMRYRYRSSRSVG